MPKVGKHSLYVESYDATTKYVNTINSWGLKKNPNPKIAIGRDGNGIFIFFIFLFVISYNK